LAVIAASGFSYGFAQFAVALALERFLFSLTMEPGSIAIPSGHASSCV